MNHFIKKLAYWDGLNVKLAQQIEISDNKNNLTILCDQFLKLAMLDPVLNPGTFTYIPPSLIEHRDKIDPQISLDDLKSALDEAKKFLKDHKKAVDCVDLCISAIAAFATVIGFPELELLSLIPACAYALMEEWPDAIASIVGMIPSFAVFKLTRGLSLFKKGSGLLSFIRDNRKMIKQAVLKFLGLFTVSQAIEKATEYAVKGIMKCFGVESGSEEAKAIEEAFSDESSDSDQGQSAHVQEQLPQAKSPESPNPVPYPKSKWETLATVNDLEKELEKDIPKKSGYSAENFWRNTIISALKKGSSKDEIDRLFKQRLDALSKPTGGGSDSATTAMMVQRARDIYSAVSSWKDSH